MRILITGGDGYIASYLIPLLIKKKYQIHILSRDSATKIDNIIRPIQYHYFKNNKELDKLLKYVNPEIIFHLAANLKPSINPLDIMETIKSNFDFGIAIVKAALATSCRLIVNLDSYKVEGIIINSERIPYFRTKSAFASMLEVYCMLGEMRVLNLKLGNIYGTTYKRGILFQIANKMVSNEKIEIENPTSTINLVNIDDAVAGILVLLDYMLCNNTIKYLNYNIVSNENINVMELCDLIKKRYTKINGNPNIYPNCEIFNRKRILLKKEDLWNPEIILEDGIDEILKFIKSDS